LALGVVVAAVVGVFMPMGIKTIFRSSSVQLKTQVVIVNLEGDAWGINGLVHAGLDGAPRATIDQGLTEIRGDIARGRRTIERLGTGRETAAFLARLATYERLMFATYRTFLAGNAEAANAQYHGEDAVVFRSVLSISAKTQKTLERRSAADERHGARITNVVLLATALAVVLLSGQVYRHRRQRAVAETREAERDRFKALIERASDMITVWDADGKILFDSPAVTRVMGYDFEERAGAIAGDLIHPDDRDRVQGTMAWMKDHPGEPTLMECRVRYRDGSYHWIEAIAINLCDDSAIRGNVANYRVIDDRKQAELAKQELMSRLLSAQEAERRRIAVDIHDDSVQVMSAVLLRLHALMPAVSTEAALLSVRRLEETVRLSITRLRRLMFELRPASLDEEGLAYTLHASLEMMSEESHIAFSVDSSLAEEPEVQTRVVLYRIAQEALANVRKHARASTVNITIREHDDGFLVEIQDDGVGFRISDKNPVGHLGLAAMRERAEWIGGWLQIESGPDGTTVRVWAPDDSLSRRRPARSLAAVV
jgi:PAS domain S-box-containing protein